MTTSHQLVIEIPVASLSGNAIFGYNGGMYSNY